MTLEEYKGKVSDAEAGQDAFATTEFGFDIWMPFAKQWRQAVIDGAMKDGSNKWTVAPKSRGAVSANQVSKDWAPMFDLFREHFDEAYNAYPKTAARVASTTMGKELGEILYDAQLIPPAVNKESGVGKYMATTGETKDYLVMDYLESNKGTAKEWNLDNVRGPSAFLSSGAKKGFAKLSKHSFDFMAEDDEEAANLEYMLARMSHSLTADQKKKGFLDNIQGIEVTTELGTKYFSDAYNELSKIEDPQKRLEQGAKNAAEKIMKEYNKVGGTLSTAYAKLSKGPKKMKGYGGKVGVETASYIGAQLVDRFWEVAERMFNQTGGAKLKGGAYLYQVPLRGSEIKIGKKMLSPLIGFVRIEPVFKKNNFKAGTAPKFGDLQLQTIATQALVINIAQTTNKTADEIAALLQTLHGDSANPNVLGLVSNWLMSDAHFNLGMSLGEATALGKDMDAQVANTRAFTSMRLEHVGSSLWVYTQGGIDHLSPKPFVQAVKTLTTPEIAASLKDQLENFLDPKKSKAGQQMAKKYARFYEEAIKKSQNITKVWVKNIKRQWKNWKGVKNSIFGKTHGYTGPKSGEGEGAAAAWFMNYNRDPGGWAEFKDRTGQGNVQYILKLLGGEVSNAGQMPGYKEAVPVQRTGTPMILEDGQLRPATPEEVTTGRSDQGVRWAAESTLGPGGQVQQGTDIFLHGGAKMGGGINVPEARGTQNPFLVAEGQLTSAFWGMSGKGKKVK
tara:strand:- start:56 stop:2248 length:2193 start_codon:yes stop_codon:yes gene_type:complete